MSLRNNGGSNGRQLEIHALRLMYWTLAMDLQRYTAQRDKMQQLIEDHDADADIMVWINVEGLRQFFLQLASAPRLEAASEILDGISMRKHNVKFEMLSALQKMLLLSPAPGRECPARWKPSEWRAFVELTFQPSEEELDIFEQHPDLLVEEYLTLLDNLPVEETPTGVLQFINRWQAN